MSTSKTASANTHRRSLVRILVAVATTLSCLSSVGRADAADADSTGAVLWWGTAADFSRPLGSFDPPGDTPQFGIGAHMSFHPGRSPLGMRLEFGMGDGEVHVDSVLVEVLPGFSSYQGVTTGNDLWWILIGAQWDPRPRGTSVYAFTSLGALYVKPRGTAGNGQYVHPEVPGLPSSSSVFTYALGVGSRLVIGKRFGLHAEAEYLHGAAADYVGSVGVEGSNPTHYAARNSAIGLFVMRLGFVRQ